MSEKPDKPVQLGYRDAKPNRPRRDLNFFDFSVAILMLLVGSGLVWLCVRVLMSGPPGSLLLIVWPVMLFIGFSGCWILYAGIKIIQRSSSE